MNVLVKYSIDYGRCGRLQGLFVCTRKELESLNDQYVNFGEVLGKHSEVDHTFQENDFKVMTDDQDFISKLVKIVGRDTISGYNPLCYVEEDEDYDDGDEGE